MKSVTVTTSNPIRVSAHSLSLYEITDAAMNLRHLEFRACQPHFWCTALCRLRCSMSTSLRWYFVATSPVTGPLSFSHTHFWQTTSNVFSKQNQILDVPLYQQVRGAIRNQPTIYFTSMCSVCSCIKFGLLYGFAVVLMSQWLLIKSYEIFSWH